jgi:hypothetical protein
MGTLVIIKSFRELHSHTSYCVFLSSAAAAAAATTPPPPPPLRSHWNIGPQQLSVTEVPVEFTFFIETGLLVLCSNPQPGGPGLHIYIPWRLGGPVIPPGTEYPF